MTIITLLQNKVIPFFADGWLFFMAFFVLAMRPEFMYDDDRSGRRFVSAGKHRTIVTIQYSTSHLFLCLAVPAKRTCEPEMMERNRWRNMEQSYISLKGQISLDFLKKRNFTGSYKEMRYNLFIKDGQLTAAIYPQPYCWECTPEEQKTYQSFETSKDGLEEAIAWLNEAYETAAWRSETDE